MTPKPQIAAAYSAAADHYDAPALRFWDYFGERTVKRAAPRPGEMVLFRFDAFHAINHMYFDGVNMQLGNRAFGQITGPGSQR